MASTAGIELYGDSLAPWEASTRGFGDAICSALDAGVSRLVLAVGSSASTDGGAGLLAALGAEFVGIPDVHAPAAKDLVLIADIDLSRLRDLPAGGAIVLTDVDASLLGPGGAAKAFGLQKGLRAEDIPQVEAALRSYAALLPADPAEPGTGAAGGAAFALRAWGARIQSGSEAMASVIDLRRSVADAALVITGEGQFDGQSARGKVAGHVTSVAHDTGTSAALVAGRILPGTDLGPFAHTLSLADLAGSSAAAMQSPRVWLVKAGAELARRALR